MLAVFCIIASGTLVNDAGTGLPLDDARIAMLAMRSTLEEIRSGICSATRTVITNDPKSTPLAEWLAFDEKRGLYRYDVEVGAARFGGEGRQLILTPEQMLMRSQMRSQGPSSVEIRRPDDRMLKAYTREQLDPTIAPLCFFSQMSSSSLRSQEDAIFDMFFDRFKVERAHDLGEGTLDLLLTANAPIKQEISLVLDAQKAFVPVRVSFRHQNDRGAWSDPEVTTTSWEQVNATFVPKVVEASGMVKGKERRLRFEMSWEAVNVPLDQQLFTKGGFDLARGDVVIDKTTDKDIVTIEGVDPEDIRRRAEMAIQDHRPIARWIILLNVLCLLIVGLYCVLSGRTRMK